ncbi:MAG: S8 family serine peptidase, partial [Phycisphaerae bacterium]
GTFSDIIAGINYGADQTASGARCDVINMSLGGGAFSGNCDSDSAAVAVNNAVANGVVVVASAGNEGNANAMGTPACASGAIAVGAVYDNNFPNCEDTQSSFNWCLNSTCTSTCLDNNISVDDLVCFSNHSTTIDVAAPGCMAVSADNAAGGTSFSGQCGTSQAGPHVTGLAALILSADPGLTPAQVRQFIRDGAIDLGPAGFDSGYGWGRIDAINSLSLLTPCTGNPDCDDGDPCTTDVCSGGSCSNTTISCPPNQTCVGGTCQGSGACCSGTSCVIDNPSNCSASGGSYLGDGTTCGSGTAGNPTVYQSSPNVAIPDGGGSGNPATDTINVPDSVIIGDVNVDLTITHTWVGDVTLTVSHLGTTVTVLDRPGVPASTWGCSLNNFSGIILDDEGTGGTIEGACQTNLSSPPNYTPNNSLSAFDGMDSAGVWTITVYDSATPDPGTLNTWSLHIDAVGSNPCTGCTTNAQCDDGVFCNGAETCNAGTCQAGTAPTCDDGIGCTDDSCNTGTDSCDNIANNANCDDGLACNGAETCDSVNDCQAGTTVNCDDGVACTTDTCNEPGGTCSNTPVNAACDDGVFCNGTETCSATLDCQAGTTPTCDDGVGCTDDSCNTGTDSCDNIPNDANCADGSACNGVETCSATLDCQAGTAVNCNDGIGCTTDACNEPSGTCSNTPNDAVCDDGLFCNGTETCDAVFDCQAGTTVNCNDGVACTDDSCNEATNSCDNVANDLNCPDDLLFCTGTEFCDAAADCSSTGDPCGAGTTCNETTDTCDSTGPPPGEGFILSRNADFSTDDRSF